MAGRVNSGLSGDLDGFQRPRRSARGRVPRIDDNFVPTYESPRRTRGRNPRNGGSAPRAMPSATGAVRRGNQGSQQAQYSRFLQGIRQPARHHTSSESDEENDGYESSDTVENLEGRVIDLTNATSKSLADLDFMVKLVFSVLPEDIIMQLQAFARTSDKRNLIEDVLDDRVQLNLNNALSRPGDLRSASGGTRVTQSARPTTMPAAAAPATLATAAAPASSSTTTTTVAMPTRMPTGVVESGTIGNIPGRQQSDVQPGRHQPTTSRPSIPQSTTNTRNISQGNRDAFLREEQRKRNIVIKGLQEDLDDGDQGGIDRMLKSMDLGYLAGRNSFAKRIGRGDNDRPRLLVVTFRDERDVDDIISAKWKLFGTHSNSRHGNFSDVFVDPDHTRDERHRLYQEREERRAARALRESLDRDNGGGGSMPAPNRDRETVAPAPNNRDIEQLIDQARHTENQQDANGSEAGTGAIPDASVENDIVNNNEAETASNTSGNMEEGAGNVNLSENTGNQNGEENGDAQTIVAEQTTWVDSVRATPRRALSVVSRVITAVTGTPTTQGNETGEGETTED